jgi:ABC-type phosphate/phosphonate transport system substrate-binding protein
MREYFVNFYAYKNNLSDDLKQKLNQFLTDLETLYEVKYKLEESKVIVKTSINELFEFINSYEDKDKNVYLQNIIIITEV